MSRREFDLGDVLSVTTSILLSPRHVEGLYDILGYWSGESLMTHQLPRVGREAQGPILRQHPQLRDIEVPDFGAVEDVREAVFAWLDAVKAVHGETLPIRPAEHDR